MRPDAHCKILTDSSYERANAGFSTDVCLEQLSSYPRLPIRSPHSLSICWTDPGGSSDRQAPERAARTNGLSRRDSFVNFQDCAC